MSDLRNDTPAPDGPESVEAGREEILAGIAKTLEGVRKGRLLPPFPGAEPPNWDLHGRRLHEMETIVRTATGPADLARFEDLEQTFHLDYAADVARVLAVVQGEMVRIFDDIGARVEEKKFELPSEARDELEDMLQPYQDRYREQMLGQLTIEKRRELEAEAKRRRETGEPPGK